MSRRNALVANIDWVILFIYFLLVFIGWTAVYSANYDVEHASIFDFKMEYGKQFVWMIVSFVLIFVLLNVEGKFYNLTAWIIYGFVLFLLVLVLVIGKEIHGNKAWLQLGGFSLQPAEFAKLATALALAKYLGEKNHDITKMNHRLKAFAIILVPVGLVMLQPDTGSALVATAFLFAMYREGMSGTILLVGISALFVGVVAIMSSYTLVDFPFIGQASLLWLFLLFLLLVAIGFWIIVDKTVIPRKRSFFKRLIVLSTILSIAFALSVSWLMKSKLLKFHHQTRIELLLGIADEKLVQRYDYNMLMAKSAIGSGGFLGKGFNNGPMTNYNFVPEQGTDFIFTAIAEEWGFVGAALVVILYVAFILRIVFIAERQKSTFSRVYAYSVAGIFFLHILINIGMVIGLAPVIGIPLPFMSYGGSSLLSFSIMIAILVRLDAERYQKIGG